MQKLHSMLSEKYKWYSDWHKPKLSGVVHWMFFVAAAFVTASFILTQISGPSIALAANPKDAYLNFSGSNSVMVLSAALGENASAITVGAWVKPSVLGTDMAFVSKMNILTSNTTQWFLGRDKNNHMLFAVVNSSGVTGAAYATNVTTDTNWHQVTGTYDGSNVNLYIDGVLAAPAAALTGSIAGGDFPVCIGGAWSSTANLCTGGLYVNGSIDDVRMYSRALSSSEISSSINTELTGGEAGLTGYWKLNDGGGQFAYDFAPTPHVGILGTSINADAGDPAWVGSVPDQTPPLISIVAPTANSTVSGTTTITPFASDNVGIAGVQFKLDGANLGAEQTVSPYSLSWNSTTVADGNHTLTAVARDAAGNSNTSVAVGVSVSNTAPPPGSWTPPIGIPNPSFGINQTIASLHGGNQNYHNKTVSGGGDLSVKMPALAAGDVVFIDSGNYTVNAGNVWSGAGTAANPIIVSGNATNRPVIKILNGGSTFVLGGSYTIYENIVFDLSASDATVDISGNHLSFRNGEVFNAQTWGPNTALILEGNNNVVYNSKIHDNGHVTGCPPGQTTCDPDFHGMGLSGDHHWIVDNQIYRNGGDGIQINAGDAAHARTIHHIYVGRNDSWGNRQSGMWIKFSSDIIFSQNKIHDHVPSDSSAGQGTGFQYGTERAWFLFNDIYNNTIGMYIASDSGPGGCGCGLDAYVIGNVFHNNSTDAYEDWDNQARKHILNNTIYGGAAGFSTFNEPAGSELRNNLVINNTGTDFDLSSNKGNETVSNNACGTSGCSTIETTCVSCVVGDPNFVNAAGGDFHLQSTSPVIDKGAVSSAYATFQSLYGINLSVDADNNPRPSGTAWDIGAYEYQGTGGGGGGTPLPGDLNGDHIINSLDYSIMNSHWFSTNVQSDLNQDGLVNSIDFSIMDQNWLKTW